MGIHKMPSGCGRRSRSDSEQDRLRRPPATKRVANSVEFMGQMVSYPQYIRLMRIQKEVINMDKVIRRMLDEYDSETLSNFEPWLELIAMYRQMRKMLPDGYVRTAG